jgi:hypothetical protein
MATALLPDRLWERSRVDGRKKLWRKATLDG